MSKRTRCGDCGHTPGARLIAKEGTTQAPCACRCHGAQTLIGRTAVVYCPFTPAAQWQGRAAQEGCDADRLDAHVERYRKTAPA